MLHRTHLTNCIESSKHIIYSYRLTKDERRFFFKERDCLGALRRCRKQNKVQHNSDKYYFQCLQLKIRFYFIHLASALRYYRSSLLYKVTWLKLGEMIFLKGKIRRMREVKELAFQTCRWPQISRPKNMVKIFIK